MICRFIDEPLKLGCHNIFYPYQLFFFSFPQTVFAVSVTSAYMSLNQGSANVPLSAVTLRPLARTPGQGRLQVAQATLPGGTLRARCYRPKARAREGDWVVFGFWFCQFSHFFGKGKCKIHPWIFGDLDLGILINRRLLVRDGVLRSNRPRLILNHSPLNL